MPEVRTWDGAAYDRISGPMEAMAREVLERLPLRGDERVLDAGCGSGRVTELLVQALPHGRVIGIDASASMVAAARERLGDRAQILQGDLLELDLATPVDAILSTATFHWIADHAALFASLRGALVAGGRLAAQCGGEGNIDGLRARASVVLARAPYAEHMVGFQPPWHYSSPQAARERLLAAGFATARCWLQPRPAVSEDPGEYMKTIVLGPHVQRLPENLRDQFVAELLGELPLPVTFDYVRLNIDATA